MEKLKTFKQLKEMYYFLITKYDNDQNRGWSHQKEVDCFRFILECAAYLHNIKSSTYKDSWKKRGWQVSVFGNISRKFDRLESIFTDTGKYMSLFANFNKDSPFENVADTFMDLGNYCFLAMGEILFTKKDMFMKFFESLSDNTENRIDVLDQIKEDSSINLD